MSRQLETPAVPADSGDAAASLPIAPGRRLDSREMFASGNELIIDHEGTSYRLRITRQGKLILTK